MQSVKRTNGRLFKTKKSIREATPEEIYIIATSVFGDEYNGLLKHARPGRYLVVGPEPYQRKWYATIVWDGENARIT